MKIIECPRDAMQGLTTFIPTETKIEYVNQLLKVGFDTIDFGSFVSAKAIPQLRDTAEVLANVNLKLTSSKLLAIVANMRGAEEASQYEAISYLGFPLSISETFQQRNTNRSIKEALNTVRDIQSICANTKQTLVAYISMGFGNPYNDKYDLSVVEQFVNTLADMQLKIISIADTIGISQPAQIYSLFTTLTNRFPNLELGAHLHSQPSTALEKIEAAFRAGCRRLDGALKGFGGCPMADDTLVGNVATEIIISYLDEQMATPKLDRNALQKAIQMADTIFAHT